MGLSHCSQLLKAGGKLVLGENITQADEDPLGSILNEADWNRHLVAFGFTGVELVTSGPQDANGCCPAMMVTSKQAQPKMRHSNVVIVQDQNPSMYMKTLSFNIFEKLKGLGLHAELVSLEQAVAEDAYGRMLIAGKALVSLLEAEVPLIATMSELNYGLLQKLLLGSTGGMWITRSNRQLDPLGDPTFSSTVGLLRTLRNENPEGRLHEVALSSKIDISSAETADLVIQATKSVFEADSLQAEPETEYGELNGSLFIPRIYDEPHKNAAMDMMGKESPTELEPFYQENNPLRLDIGIPSDFDTLRFVHDPLALEPLHENEVEIEVHASGLSYS